MRVSYKLPLYISCPRNLFLRSLSIAGALGCDPRRRTTEACRTRPHSERSRSPLHLYFLKSLTMTPPVVRNADGRESQLYHSLTLVNAKPVEWVSEQRRRRRTQESWEHLRWAECAQPYSNPCRRAILSRTSSASSRSCSPCLGTKQHRHILNPIHFL